MGDGGGQGEEPVDLRCIWRQFRQVLLLRNVRGWQGWSTGPATPPSLPHCEHVEPVSELEEVLRRLAASSFLVPADSHPWNSNCPSPPTLLAPVMNCRLSQPVKALCSLALAFPASWVASSPVCMVPQPV